MGLAASTRPLEPPSMELSDVTDQAETVFDDYRQTVFQKTDRLLAAAITLQWLGSIAAGGNLHAFLTTSLFAPGGLIITLAPGAALTVLAVFLALAHAGRPQTRHLLAFCQIAISIPFRLSPHLAWGESLHIYGALALLALYRDWRVLASASGLALLLQALFAASSTHFWALGTRAGGLAVEGVLLAVYCRQSIRGMKYLAKRQILLQTAQEAANQMAEKNRIAEEDLHAAHEQLTKSHREWEEGARQRADELAQANDALQRNNSVLRAQQEATADGVLIVNEERDISHYNQRFCEIWQVPDGLMTADEDWTLLEHVLSCVKNQEAFQALMTHCYHNPGKHAQDEVELADGRILERYTRPIFSDKNCYYGRVWYFRDITERKHAESQILGLNRKLSHANEAIIQAYDATISGWSRALDMRDKETEGHCQRVTELTLRLAVSVGMCGDELIQIRRGALLHDIGKMGVPDHILLKPGPLTDQEWSLMRRHPQYAYEMLSPIAFLCPALEIPWCHHEKWDGTGYPRGLKGTEIPIAARLFAMVDVWDALRSDRPYRKAWPADRVRAHIQSLAGIHFDPDFVPIFLSVVSRDDVGSDFDLFPQPKFDGKFEDSSSLPWAA